MSGIFAKYAQHYAGIGYPVFPLAEGEKVPAIRGGGGHLDATTDPAQIARWAKQYPNANIGVATTAESGITVIDVDPRTGGLETMQKLSRAGFKLPETITAKSCQDGFHCYFRHNSRVELGTLGKGVDVKHAGYVVAPPSRWSGNDGTYSWLVAPFGGRLQEAPEWVLKRLIRPPAPKYERTVDLDEGRIESRIAGAIERIAKEPEGSRNFILNTCAYHIRRYSLATDMSREVLFAECVRAGMSAGLSRKECEGTVGSAFRGAERMGSD